MRASIRNGRCFSYAHFERSVNAYMGILSGLFRSRDKPCDRQYIRAVPTDFYLEALRQESLSMNGLLCRWRRCMPAWGFYRGVIAGRHCTCIAIPTVGAKKKQWTIHCIFYCMMNQARNDILCLSGNSYDPPITVGKCLLADYPKRQGWGGSTVSLDAKPHERGQNDKGNIYYQ